MKANRTFIYLSLPLAILVITDSVCGLYLPGMYSLETPNWQAQSVGQDIVDLFLATPVLLITAVLAAKGSKVGGCIWAGSVLYLLYTFVIYCFDVHFNRLFVVYCFTLGLSFYSFMWFLYHSLTIRQPIPAGRSIQTIKWYFFLVPVVFYFLWLSEIIPANISNTAPASLAEVGLPTNPVHIIDLAIFLPALFLVGLLMQRKHPLGFILAPVFLTFCVLMNITIAALVVVMRSRGIASGLQVTYIMTVLAVLSVVLLMFFFKSQPAAPVNG